MLDQNITVLLSTLLGGVLTITGGFIATYYTQSHLEKKDKRNEIRDVLEKVYQLSFAVDNHFKNILMDLSVLDHNKLNEDKYIDEIISVRRVFEIHPKLNEMGMFIRLYINPLVEIFDHYIDYLNEIENVLNIYKSFENKSSKLDDAFIIINNATGELLKQIKKILKEEGYSYF